jgi:hypothetical protein
MTRGIASEVQGDALAPTWDFGIIYSFLGRYNYLIIYQFQQ